MKSWDFEEIKMDLENTLNELKDVTGKRIEKFLENMWNNKFRKHYVRKMNTLTSSKANEILSELDRTFQKIIEEINVKVKQYREMIENDKDELQKQFERYNKMIEDSEKVLDDLIEAKREDLQRFIKLIKEQEVEHLKQLEKYKDRIRHTETHLFSLEARIKDVESRLSEIETSIEELKKPWYKRLLSK